MGKRSKWLNNLLRRCRGGRTSVSRNKPPAISSGRGGEDGITAFAANCREQEFFGGGGGECNKHAIAVAAATAAVAEAALAAARAAAEVVRLTNNVNVSPVSRRWCFDDLAAVKIQSAFRGFLARKALKALRGLVKLQALVRGHFVRKQSAEMLRRLQAMVRVQARARSNRILSIESSNSSPGNANPRSYEILSSSEKLEESPVKRSSSNSSIKDSKCSENAASASNWLDNWVEVGSSINNSNLTKTPHTDDEKNDKILEVDSWKPDTKSRTRNPNNIQPLRHISAKDYYDHSFAASDYLARYSPKVGPFAEDNLGQFGSNRTIESSSPQTLSGASRTASMRRSPKTPSRDECSKSYLNGYATFASPSYMANTQSSRARSRSHSVPRQREHDPEKLGSIKRSLHAFWESKTSSKRNFDSQRW
ncbi:hypothetical protein KSS87_015475 [Heliosperma pusillum]|nr:hypothetical protein KSS87_015475 [Heliosperma pusillum]